MAIPKGRNSPSPALPGQSITGSGNNVAWIRANEQIGALGDGNGALGVFPQGKARNPQSGGFFLDATGIGEDELGFAQQAEKIEIADGWYEAELGVMLDAA